MIKTEECREEFINSNLGLVHSLARRFTGKGIDYEDLYQTGCIGLIKAYEGFDESRGIQFSTYAVPVILGEMRRLFRDGGIVKVSRTLKELGIRIAKEKNEFEQKKGRQPTVNELAEILSVSPEEITEAVCAGQSVKSLTYEGEDGVKECELPTVSVEDEVSDRLELSRAFQDLTETEKQLIRHRYFEFLTQDKTAKLLHISQVQVSRTEKKVLMKLRRALG